MMPPHLSRSTVIEIGWKGSSWHKKSQEGPGTSSISASHGIERHKKLQEEPKEDTNGRSVDQAIDVDDDIVEISNGASNGEKKRPHDEENGNGTAAKKARYD